MKKKFYYLIFIAILTLGYSVYTNNFVLKIVLNNAFIINLPFFCVSVVLFTIERGMYNPLVYSFKRSSLFFHKRKREYLMKDLGATDYTDLEEKLRSRYLYSNYKFKINEYILLPSSIIFTIILIYFFIIA